ncbi:MAG TPA: ATP-binding protein, partial [Gemmatimonadales bacterium]|nr:ATP-binding protein [Gemmatimonadales bacterium]
DYASYLAGVRLPKSTSSAVSAVVARTGEPKLVSEIDPATVVAQSDEALKPLVARLNVHSFAVVPIRARGVIIGTLSMVRSGPGRGYTADDLTLLQDLADRAGLAIANARLYDDLERRVRLRTADLELVNEELEAFSYSVSHDLRAPLRAIDGFSQALLDDHASQLDEQGREYLGRVRGATHRMTQLIDDLLSLARITRAQLKRERVDVTDVARKILTELGTCDRQRQVATSVADDLVVQADPRLITVMLENLLGNAWKFTAKRERATIDVGTEVRGAETVYFVRDNGAGFAMDHATKLFAPFQRLHAASEFEGTGIGLAIVNRVVMRHGGRVWADAALDQGATFFFMLGKT